VRVPRSLSTDEVRRALSTRRGTVAIAGVVAVLAGAMLTFFLSQYRASVNPSGKPVTVLVAESLIEKGSSGDVIAAKGLFDTNTIRESQRKDGAIQDASSLRGKVASADIYPGEQLTTSKFSGTANGVGSKIAGRERAITLPLDAAHGMIGDVKAGDHVDVLGGFNTQFSGDSRPRPVLKPVMQDALVLSAPEKPKPGGLNGPNNTQNIVLRAPDDKAWDFAFSSEYGKVWIVLRPKAGAEQSRPRVVTLERLLFGTKAIKVGDKRGGPR